jgi:AraC family transcriptional regulator
MQPTIINKDQMVLLGFSFFGDPFEFSAGWTEENEIGHLWRRLMVYLEAHAGRIRHVKSHTVMVEVHIEHEETALTGEHEVFVGLEVERLEDVPVELVAKILPATTYAVFTLHGEQINSDWTQLIYGWMSQSEYQRAYAYGLQWYDERFKGLERMDESAIDVYVPVKRK